MKKTITLMMLLVAFVFTSCSDDYNTKSEELSPFYEEALYSEEFASFCMEYNQYTEAINLFASQLSEEQIENFISLLQEYKKNPQQNAALFEHLWEETAKNEMKKLEFLYTNAINSYNTFSKRFDCLLSEQDKQELSLAISKPYSFLSTSTIMIKTRAVENNKEQDEEDDDNNNDSNVEDNDSINTGNSEDNENSSNTNKEKCKEECKYNYDKDIEDASFALICEKAIYIACLLTKNISISERLANMGTNVVYAYLINSAKEKYDRCLENC